jgi:hypothetical protein
LIICASLSQRDNRAESQLAKNRDFTNYAPAGVLSEMA